jgi:hypothetical protein
MAVTEEESADKRGDGDAEFGADASTVGSPMAMRAEDAAAADAATETEEDGPTVVARPERPDTSELDAPGGGSAGPCACRGG